MPLALPRQTEHLSIKKTESLDVGGREALLASKASDSPGLLYGAASAVGIIHTP